jgi:Leucine-rich repeat (LRR) protein
MDDKDNFALVRKSSSAVERIAPRAKQIVSGMVADTLALTKKFRLGEYEWCESDYRQILIWANEAHKSPEAIIQRLVETKSSFKAGRLIEVHWDDGSFPIQKFIFVRGLQIKMFHVLGGARTVGIINSRKIPGVGAADFEVSEMNLDGLSELEVLAVASQNLKKLNLRHTPKLKRLFCQSNFLVKLDLSSSHELAELWCSSNELTELNLSAATKLEELDCGGNQIEELDIRPLASLRKLKYDAAQTRLIQRPDQHF